MQVNKQNIEIHPYKGVDNTLKHIYELVMSNYQNPVLQVFDKYTLQQVFDYVSKGVPYVPDPTHVPIAGYNDFEMLKAPDKTIWFGGDCDDKAILLGCILERKGIPYRFVVTSSKPDKSLHHIYLEVLVEGQWLPFDATYPKNRIFTEIPFTRKRIYYLKNGSLSASDLKPENWSALYCNSQNGCDGCSEKGKCAPMAMLAGDESLNGTKLAILRGKAEKLGIIPVGTVLAVASIAAKFFGSFFGAEQYQDLYNVWNAAAGALPALINGGKYQEAASARALIGVLGVDYMNPPEGANFCDSQGKCGNAAHWAEVSAEVQSKAAQFAPFVYWLMAESGQGNTVDMGAASIYSYYRDMKSNGPLYQQFKAKYGKKGLQLSQAGAANTFIVVAMLGAAVFILSKNKKRFF